MTCSSHQDTIHFVTLPFNTSIIWLWHPIFWQMHINFLGTEYISSVVEVQHLNIQTAWENRDLNSTFTNTAVATFPDSNLKWQLKNDGEAPALSELLLHPSMTHGSDCHCYVARVHQNSAIGTLYTMDGTYGWGGRQLPITTDSQPQSLYQC